MRTLLAVVVLALALPVAPAAVGQDRKDPPATAAAEKAVADGALEQYVTGQARKYGAEGKAEKKTE